MIAASPWQARLNAVVARAARSPRRWLWAAGLVLLLAAVGVLLRGWAAPAAEAGPLAQPGPFDALGLVAGILLKLGFVLLLAYGSLYWLRRLQGASPARAARRVAVLDTVRLSPRQALHVVRAGEQVLLIGATDQGLSLLTELHADQEPVSAPASPSFGEWLSRLAPAAAPAGAHRSNDAQP